MATGHKTTRECRLATQVGQLSDKADRDAGITDAERRTSERHVTIYHPGKIVLGDVEELCLVRNISTSGAMAQVGSDYCVGNGLILYLRVDEPIPGAVAWVRDGHIGIAFSAPIDLSVRLGPVAPGMLRPRAPRLNVPAEAHAQIGDNIVPVTLADISQNGAKLCCGTVKLNGGDIKLTIDGLGTFTSIVRWSRAGMAGVSFLRTIPIWDLNSWAVGQRKAVD